MKQQTTTPLQLQPGPNFVPLSLQMRPVTVTPMSSPSSNPSVTAVRVSQSNTVQNVTQQQQSSSTHSSQISQQHQQSLQDLVKQVTVAMELAGELQQQQKLSDSLAVYLGLLRLLQHATHALRRAATTSIHRPRTTSITGPVASRPVLSTADRRIIACMTNVQLF